ncbi:MAG TPA: mechanosensitive ion channel family protein [Pseudonocardiaceae bacterium]|jgi:small conductance mechanosensitive channel|nr:mechanosensitive ion channel family protein [Pseudonocardiaceae bacterium]HEX2290962.1 mechanosensitive ion channel family protein [Pseudonocardiaceae bacterium]
MTAELIFQPDCVDEVGSWCSRIFELTHNDMLARYADAVVGTGLRILLIVTVAVLVRLMAHRAINRLTRVTAEGPQAGLLRPLRERAPESWRGTGLLSTRRSQRARTIGSVLRSGTTFVVSGVAITLVLGELGINLGPIIASAGILGVALGFGAQNLVKDFLSGMFMMVEDQYGVGDIIDLGEATGTVEAVGLRVTTLRDVNGTVWYVRNGEVLRVGNSSQGYSVAVVDLPVGHDADIPETSELAGRTAIELTAEGSALADDVLEPPEVLGVESISPGGVTLRITTKVRAGRQWAVQRALLAGIKDAFADAGIPPPSPVSGLAAPPT